MALEPLDSDGAAGGAPPRPALGSALALGGHRSLLSAA
jgi:hypothetical protein